MSDLNKLFDEIGYFDQEAPIDDRGEFRKGATSALKNTISGGKALLGALTSDFSAQYDALTDMERTGRENAPKVGRIEDIDGLDKFGDWLAYNLGSGTASIGTMVAGGGLGGLAVKGLAKGALVNAGKAIGAGSMGFAPNYGESLNNAYEEAGEIENQAAFAAATIKTALDSFTPLKILRSTGRAGVADAITDRVKQKLVDDSGFKTWAKEILKTGATEAFTEGLQSYTDQVMVNVLAEEGEVFGVRDWSELLNSAAAGAAGSAGFGTYSGVQQARIGAGLKQQSLNQNAYVDEILRKAPSIDDAINRGEQVDLTSTTKVVDNEETAYDPAIQSSINYDTPAVARNAGVGGSASEIYRFGNGFVDNASMRQGNRAAQQNPLVPMNDAGEESQTWQPNWQFGNNDMPYRGQMQPYIYEGEYEQYRDAPRSVPVGAALDAPVIDGQFERPRGLPDRSDVIYGEDGRPMQQAQEFADSVGQASNRALPFDDVIYAPGLQPESTQNENAAGDAYWQEQQARSGNEVNRRQLEREAQNYQGAPQIPQKDIIFADDGRGVQVKRNGKPFGGRRAAELTKEFRQAKSDGLNPKVVKINGGYGWVTSGGQQSALNNDSVEGVQPEQSALKTKPAVKNPKVNNERTTKVYTPTGREVDVEYAIVDADQLVTSNLDDGRVNQDYPQLLQPRDRTRASSEIQINSIANNINPALLGESATTGDGAPIVSDAGVVESGNGRSLAIRRAYQNGKAGNYRNALIEQGYDVSGVEKPVLVRVRRSQLSDEDLIAYTKESNERSTLSLSASELAQADAKAVNNIIADYNGGDVSAAANRDFVRKFMQGAVSQTEQASMIDSKGMLSQDGRRRIEAAMISAAYDDSSLVNDLFESSDNEIKSIGGALLDASGAWAKMRSSSQAGATQDNVDITPNVVEAVNLVRRSRSEGKKLSELVSQTDIFAGDIDPVTKMVIGLFYGGDNFTKPRSRQKVSQAIAKYAELAGNTQGGDSLFGGELETVSPDQLLNKANEANEQTERQEAGQGGLFSQSVEPARPSGEGDRGTGQRQAVTGNEQASAQPQSQAEVITAAANEAATSPTNDLPEPTPGQKEAGNYKKGKVKLHGFDISIENPKGSTRTGTDPDGKEWSSKMKHHYGDIKGTTGADGDSIDVFIGDNPDSQKVFVVDQVDPGTGSFDEVKVMMGFNSLEDARKGYLSNYDKNWKGLGEISETTVDEFKAWTKRPRKSRQAFAYKPSQPESNAPLFSLSSDSIATNSNNSRVVSASDADKVVSRFADSFSNSMADSFVVASTFDDLPADIKDAAKAQGAEYQVKGVFHKGKTYVVSDQHTSELDVETTLFHEVYGHQGVAKLFGKDITKKLNELFLANGGLKGLRDTAKRHGVNLDSYINGLNGTAMPQDIKNRVLMDELLAHMQQSNKPSVKRLVREIVGMLRAGLRKLGLPGLSKVADSDLFYILKQARKATAGGKPSTVATSSFRTSESTSIDESPLFNRTMSNAKEKLGLGEEELLSIVDRAKKSWEDFSWKGFKERAKEGLFDSLYGIKKAEDAMNVTTEESGYISARLAQGVGDVVHAVMFHGAPQWRNGIVQMKPDTKGLLEVFSQLDTNELNDWLAWMGGNRADKLMKEGRENNLTANEIAELKGLNVGREALFNRVKDEYNAINAATLDMAIEAGLLSRDTVNKFDSEWYVPFFRAEDPSDIDEVVHGPLTTKGISNASAQIKTLKGGSQSTKDILQNILQRQATMIDAAMKNKAMIEVADNLAGTPYMQPANLNKMEIEAVIKKRLAKKATPYVSVVMDGETKWFEVQEPSLLRALTQLSVKRADNPLMKMSRAAKRFLTTGVTLSPEFIIRNFLRDGVHGWMINKDKFTFGLDSAKGVIKTWKKDQATIDLMFAGASFQGGYVHAGDPEQGAQQIRRALRKKGLNEGDISKYMASIPKGAGELLEKYRSWSDSMENANRVATYDSSLKAGKSKKQAVFEAKDFMDFGLQGNFAAMQFFVDVIPFLNARMQGLYKLYRAGKAGKGDSFAKVLSKELAMKGMYVAGFSLALALVNMDDERYDELPDWDKDANWHFFFGDTHVRIPKPFELGIIFGTLPERLFMRASGKQNNDDLGRSMGHAVVSTMAMNPIPQIIKPGFEAWANYDMFSGRPIESFSDQYKRPEDRYSMYTTESAKRLAKLFGVSPKKLEHLVRGYTGTLGSYVLSAADVVGNSYASLSGSGEFKLNEFDDLSVVRAFVKTGEVGGTYYGEQFYDTLQEINGLYKQFQNAQQEQDAEAAKEIIDENKGKIRFRGMFNKAQAQLNKLNHQMTIIWKNEKIPLAEREKKIDEINSMKNAIYRRVVLEYRKLND